MEFNVKAIKKLLEKIKEYRGDGSGYFLIEGEVGSHISGETYEKSKTHHIVSAQLKKRNAENYYFWRFKRGWLSKWWRNICL